MKKIILIVSSAITLSSFAQKKVEVKAYLLDGSNITGSCSLSSISLVTDYGKMLFPVEKVNTINIGIGKDKAVYDKTASLLKVLNNSNNDDTRKAAYNDIAKLGPKAISAIEEYSSETTDYTYTGEFTNENLLSEIKAISNVTDISDVNDVVTFDNGYTVGGNYEFSKIDIKTEYGQLTVPKEKIKSMDIIFIDNTSAQQNFKLLANKHISGNLNGGWLKTGILLKAGQRFTISATGEIILASLSATQKYKPSGAYSENAGSSYPTTDSSYGDTNATSTYPSYGNVVFKIGETDTEVKRAGGKFTGVAKTSGMLYLSIYETVYSASNTGTYSVKITK